MALAVYLQKQKMCCFRANQKFMDKFETGDKVFDQKSLEFYGNFKQCFLGCKLPNSGHLVGLHITKSPRHMWVRE